MDNIANLNKDYMSFMADFHRVIRDNKIILVYEGEVNQTITKAFATMTESNVHNDENSRTVKKLYHVTVECLQNICKHAHEEITGNPISPGRGIFMISNNDNQFTITTGNVMSNQNIDSITDMIDRFNALGPDEIKDEYKKMIKESRLSEKGGAGLGLIDIVKKTGNKIEYHFDKLNDKTSFFIQKSVVNRI